MVGGRNVAVRARRPMGGGRQTMRAFQPMFQHQRLIGKNLDRRAIGDDFPPIKEDNAGAELDDQFKVVGSDQPGGRDPPEQSLELPAGTRVEAGGGLVENKHARVARQDPRQTDAALFAAAEAMGRPPLKAFEPDLGEGSGDDLRQFPRISTELLGPNATSSKTVGQKS